MKHKTIWIVTYVLDKYCGETLIFQFDHFPTKTDLCENISVFDEEYATLLLEQGYAGTWDGAYLLTETTDRSLNRFLEDPLTTPHSNL